MVLRGGQFLMSEVPLQGRGWSVREGVVSYPRGTPVGQGLDPGVVERSVGTHGHGGAVSYERGTPRGEGQFLLSKVPL